ncbi:interleukin-15 isoform X1 [Festucalex cinctus]
MTTRLLVLLKTITRAGIRLRLCPHLCRDRHTTQVWWLCVFVLSFLSSASCALSVRDSQDLQQCLSGLTPFIQNSSAMLYAPSMNDIQAKCDNLSLKCFLVELVMVIGEEDVDIDNDDVLCILNFNDNLHLEGNAISCPPCEAHSLGNVTTFLNRLKTLLQAMAQ